MLNLGNTLLQAMEILPQLLQVNSCLLLGVQSTNNILSDVHELIMKDMSNYIPDLLHL